MRSFKLYLLLFLFSGVLCSQNVLQVIKVRPGSFKKYELYTNDVIEYKLKGQHRYKKDVILNMNTDRLLLQNDSIISLSEIKAFRFRRPSHLLQIMNGICFIGGVGYLGLNVINNALLDGEFKLDQKALYVGGGFIAAGVIIKLIRVKHVRVGSNTSLKIIETSYQNLGK